MFDVLIIQESKLDDSFPCNQFHVPLYKCHRNDYKNNEGGIMMFIRNDLPQRRRYDIESHATNNANGRIGLLAVHVTIKHEAWFLICIINFTSSLRLI